jgi:TPP-dependent pyruvate/acetoin dehydrogenase alpha subunit
MAKTLDTKSPHAAETASAPLPSLISDQKLIAIYTMMVRCRMLGQKVATLFQQGKLDADLHTSAGREAGAVAVGVDLQPEDTLSIASGDWLPAFVKGLPTETLFRLLASRIDGYSAPAASEAQKRNIFQDRDTAEQAATVRDQAERLHAAKTGSVVAVFLQPARHQGNHWQELISAAAARKLPVIFVQHVVDNRVQPPVSVRPENKAPQALLHGVPSIAVDAADAVALYRVAYEAITRARQGRGATILECAAIPTIASADPVTRQPVQPPDPVAIMETYLKRKEISPEHHNREVVAEFTRDLELATRFLSS